MSPNEINKIRKRLFPALLKLGWKRFVNIRINFSDKKTRNRGWKKNGKFIIMDDDISEGLAEELIRIAT